MKSTAVRQTNSIHISSAPAVRLNELRHPTAHPLQGFVDGLVEAYAHDALHERVVRMDIAERPRLTVVNLDDQNDGPSEDDIMAARIFPATREELQKQEMLAHLDVVVENYANLVISVFRNMTAVLLRTFTVCYVIALKSGVYVRRLVTELEKEMRAEERARNESVAQLREHFKENHVVHSVSASPALRLAEPVTAAVLHAPVYTAPAHSGEERVPTTIFSYGTAWAEEGDITEKPCDSASVFGVAEALYLQFRYGSKSIRHDE